MIHTVTLAEIKSYRPCTRGWKILLESLPVSDRESTDKPISYLHILEVCTIQDAIWGLRCNKAGWKIAVQFARKCADSIAHLKNSNSRYAADAYAATAYADAAAAAADAAYVAYAAAATARTQHRQQQKQWLIELCQSVTGEANMTIAELITKLQQLPQDATPITDLCDKIVAVYHNVSTGIVHISGVDIKEETEDWRKV